MKKGTSPLRMSLKNSPRRFCLDGNNNFAETNSFQEPNAKDHSFSSLRPPLCPIPEANYNLPTNTNTEHDLSTPRGKCDAVTPLHRTKMFPSGQGLNQLSENTCRGSNFSTPENDLLSSSTGLTCTKNRFGWQEQRAQSSSATETDIARCSTGLVKYLSNGSAQETSLLCDSTLPASSENDNVGTPTSGVARSLKYNQAVTSSTGSLPNLPATDMQTVATIRSLPSDSKNNFVQHHFELQEDESFWDDHSVQVVIRIRPLSSIEIASQGHSRCIRQDSSHTITWLGHPESRFTFDLVAGEKITQENLFKVAGLPMVENCMGGYNSCMFAYGQTGSGKTHTMLGDLEDACQKPSTNHGMTPRVFEYLFTRIRKEEEARREEKLKFVCKCSFLEIYNEQVADLLEPSSANLQMREDAKKGVYVENLSELEVKSVHDVIRLLLQGAANRKVAATNMNRASSRSHSVFTCVIESKWESQSVTHHRFGRLNLVDLAGSERQKSSGAEGERLKEASNINKSLSTLGLVIMNLVNVANGKPQHVPYRDSKLTFLLQDSLGGNSKTTIIANVSPSNCCAMETLSTLKFAQRAKFIRNNATINEDATGDVIALRMQIQQLKEENNRLRGQLKGVSEPPQEDDYGNMSLLSSPGLRVWDSMKALASPVLTNKKRRELESALVGALKREQATEKSRKAISAENEQLKRLVKQREAEAQCTKMLLRFREEKIKRLEAVASDKLSAEAHLLKENNMLMEELQLLQNRLQRNPEVTRFAMENIRLMEQLRRFQEFYEGGEQERMTEQIEGLQVQLLEALDWKLMHQQDPNLENQKEASEGELSAITEENGFLHRQVEQYRREAEALRNNLSFCLEAKEKLERRLDDLMIQINEKKVSGTERGVELDTAIEVTEYREDETMRERLSPQKELKDLVEAISAASQREAEAQELLDDLRKKLKESVEYNERLIDMYDKITQERDEIRETEKNARDVLEKSQEQVILLRKQVEELQKEITERNRTFISMDDTSMKDSCMKWQDGSNIGNEAEHAMLHLRKEVEEYRSKLQDTSEENERLLELYEKAMQERDDIRRLWWNCEGKNASEQHATGMVAGTQVSPGELETLVEGHDETTEDNVEIRLSMEGASDECGSFNGEDVEMEVIRLRKEGEEYQMKLKDILEENERLIDMYEKAMREKDEIWKLWQTGAERKSLAELNVSVNGHIQAPKQRKEAEQPHIELQDIAEENERLTVLQKVSLQEKDCRLTSPESAIEGFSRAKLGEESEVTSPTNDIEHFQMQWRGTEENNKMLDEQLKKESMEESKAETDQHDVLQKEVENLQMKLREMAKDNKRLFKIYEDSVQEKAEMQKLCKCMASNMQKVEGESEKEYQKLDMDFEPPQLELAGTRDIEDIPQKESSAAAVEAFSLLTGADSDQNVKTQQDEIQNFQSQLQRMTQENGKLIFMYEKATQERNELANLWERATDALKHAEVCEDGSHNAARGSQIVSGNPGCVIGSKEIEVLQESRMQTEAKVIGIFEREHEDFATARVDECNAPEQANLGKNMHGNLESDRVFSFLTKEVDKLQSKMKEMAEEYESLALRYEETANEKDKIRKALQKTAQELENSTKERSFFSREIEDLKLKLKDTRGRSQETVMTNEGTVENLDEVSAEDSSKAIDIHLGQDDANIKVKQLKELQTRQTENETAPEMKHLKQVIALHCAENAGNLDEVWNEKKLKQLQEREHHVQQKFEEMDLKLSNVGSSMDNLDVLKERLEIDLDIIHGQSLELVSSIAVKEKKLKDLQLDLECLKIRLQEAEQSRDNVCHLSTAERGKWAEKEAELQREKDLMIEHMANREKILVQELTLARSKLCSAQERLAEVTRAVDSLSLLEKSHNEMDKLRKETDSLQLKISQKKQEIESLETCADQMHGKKIRAQNKFSALKTLLADLSASEEYWKCRESRANAKVETFACLMKEKMKEMGDLQADKKALEAGIKETLEMEAVALAEVHDLKEKLQLAEQQRVDAEKTVVLLDKQASSCTELRESAEQISVHFGKAASLLKGEEERMKLFTALKKSSDIVKYHRAKTENLEAKSKLVDSSICQVQSEIETASAALKDAELALQRTLNEKQMLIDSQEEGKKEMDILILELQFSEFEVKSKEEELKNSREDLQGLMNRLAELQDKNTDDEKSKQKLELEYCLLSQLLLVKLKDVHTSIWETEASLDSLQLPQNEVFKELDV